MQPRREAQLRFLAELAPLKLPLFLIGGIAEDALLGHVISRQRADVDFLVEESSWETVQAQLEPLGAVGFEPRFVGPDGRALAFASHNDELEVEVWLCRPAFRGCAVVLPGRDAADGRRAFFELQLGADTFLFPAAVLEDVSVQTVSPLALTLLRLTSAQTRGDLERRR